MYLFLNMIDFESSIGYHNMATPHPCNRSVGIAVTTSVKQTRNRNNLYIKIRTLIFSIYVFHWCTKMETESWLKISRFYFNPGTRSPGTL